MRKKVRVLTGVGLVLLVTLVAVGFRLQESGRSPTWARSDPGGMSAVLACSNFRDGLSSVTGRPANGAEATSSSFEPLPPRVPEAILYARTFAIDAAGTNPKYEPLLDRVTAVAYGGSDTSAVMDECTRLRLWS
jgi:hypothetical protein